MRFTLPPSPADPDSWAFVTVFKAASTYVTSVLAALFGGRRVPWVDLATYAFAHNLDEDTFCIENEALLRTPGYFFGAFRDAYIGQMPSLAAARVIAHVRDPRDCLVSNHYSLAFSHPLPTEAGPIRDKLLADRNIYSSRTVDESVLADCESFSRVFEELNGLNGRIPALYLSKYEDMVADFDGWLDRLCNFTRCGHLTDIKSQIRAGANFNVEENKFNHMRQVSPGDFRRKLSPETQHILTERLAPVLQSLGYSCKL